VTKIKSYVLAGSVQLQLLIGLTAEALFLSSLPIRVSDYRPFISFFFPSQC